MRKILIVDDDPQFRGLLVPLLSARGYQLLEAATGKAGQDLLEAEQPDLIVVDGLLPDTDGMTWIQRLRAAGYRTPVIFASAFWKDKKTFHRLTSEMDVAAVVQKPVVPQILVNQIAQHFADDIEIDEDDTEIHIEEDTQPEVEVEIDVEVSLAALQRDYGKSLPGKVEEISAVLHKLLAVQNTGAREELRMLAHRLRGTAGSYGFVEVGEVAGQLEEAILALREGEPIPASDGECLGLLVTRLQSLARIASGVSSTPAAEESPVGDRILVVDDDPSFLEYVQELARRHATDIIPARSVASALEAAQLQKPDAAILDVRLGSDDVSFRLASKLREQPGCDALPIAFISATDSIATRISAAHAGGSIFLTKPIEPSVFADAVQQLLSERPRKPRVLALDDDADFGSRLSVVLQKEGMSFLALQNPQELLEQLERFRPDVLLLDVMLPKVSGFDVCRMLRTAPEWRDLPILFLTGRTGIDVRVAAFRAGGDDYLAKPIVPEELLARIQVRLDRATLMKERAERDALTGISLRRAFMSRFGAYVAEADRKNQPVSIALLDIDHFKHVNDTHGHLSGDRVLARFGRLLSTRFRAGDLRARWGGEEFILCFPNEGNGTTSGIVERLLAEVREMSFESDSGSERFEVTFSAGIASFPADGSNVHDLVRAADRRLYVAKRQGRNQVVNVG